MLTAVAFFVTIQIVGMILTFAWIGDARSADDESARFWGDFHR